MRPSTRGKESNPLWHRAPGFRVLLILGVVLLLLPQTMIPTVAISAAPTLLGPSDGAAFTRARSVPPFTWEAVEGAAAYQVDLNSGERTSPWLADLAWQPNDLRAGEWTWRVRAKIGNETTPWSPAWTLIVDRDTSGRNARTTPTASLNLAAASATVGTNLTANGAGFTPGETVTVHWLSPTGALLAELDANSEGAFTTPLPIPDTPVGERRIVAVGNTSGASTEGWVTIVPSLDIAPAAALPGEPVTVTLTGFGANEAFNLFWGDAAGPNWGAGRTGVNGSAQIATSMPDRPAATYDIVASGLTTGATALGAVRLEGAADDTPALLSGGTMSGPATFRVTATVEGLLGGTTSAGELIDRKDRFVSLPACTTTSCPWLEPGTADAAWAERIECGDRCYVRVVNPESGRCAVAPVLETGPWFTIDDWWNPAEIRHLNTLPSTVHQLAQGYPGSDAALDGYDIGFGRSQDGIGISNKGYVVGNRSAIDLSNRTWQDIGFDLAAGIGTVDVTILWMTDEDIAAAQAACEGSRQRHDDAPSAEPISATPVPASESTTTPEPTAAAESPASGTPSGDLEAYQDVATSRAITHLPNPDRIQSLVDQAKATVAAESEESDPTAAPTEEPKRERRKHRDGAPEPTPPAEGTLPSDAPITGEPAAAPTPYPVPTGDPVFVVFSPVADTSVTNESPDRPQPEIQQSVLPIGGPSDSTAYVTFQLDGVAPGSVVSAHLVITGAIGFWGPVSVAAIPGYWTDEATLTWNTQPWSDVPATAADGTIAAYAGLPADTEVVADVTGTVGAGGVVTFVLRGTPDAGQAVGSRESSIPCRLEVEYIP